MSAQDLVGLIEEMIEIKVRQHAAVESRHHYPANHQLARVVQQSTSADRQRLNNVRQMLVQVLEGA
jgi:hypothetical protein